VLPICRSKSGLIATLLLNDSPEMEEMNPPSAGWADSCLAKWRWSGIQLARCGHDATVPRQLCQNGSARLFPAQSRYFRGGIWPIVARLWRVFPASSAAANRL